MTGSRLLPGILAGATVLTLSLPAYAYQRPGTDIRASVASNGGQGNGPSGFSRALGVPGLSMTPDGRYVAFISDATNLTPGDTNGLPDVFVRDLRTGRTVRASVNSAGQQGIETPADVLSCGALGAQFPAISADGRYVAFSSCFSNLVPGPIAGLYAGDTNETMDVFVHDMRTGVTQRVSVASNGAQAMSGVVGALSGRTSGPAISNDGRYVVFESTATNLTKTPNPAQALPSLSASTCGAANYANVFVHDRDTGRTSLVSAAPDGSPGNCESTYPSISPDGRYVSFYSTATNLVIGFTLADYEGCIGGVCDQAYVRDLRTGKTKMISVGLNGRPASALGMEASKQAFGADDRYVEFYSDASQEPLVPNNSASNGNYVYDQRTGRIECVSVGNTGQSVNAGFTNIGANMSGDGRYVSEQLGGSGLQLGTASDVYVHDALTGATDLVVTGSSGSNATSNQPGEQATSIGADGREVAFSSWRSDVVAGDTNQTMDVFERDRGRALGVGGLVGEGRLTIAGAAEFARTGILSVTAGRSEPNEALSIAGTAMIQATIAYRPHGSDLFTRLAFARMPLFATASPAVLYGFDMSVKGVRYEIRIAKTGLDATFSLFRQTPAGWTKVASLAGGYGTTGQEVVAALPLQTIGLQDGGAVSAVSAFSALGSTLTGPLVLLDRLSLTH